MLFCFLSSADVSITLRNKGRDAYKPEVYGPAIIVDLRITRDGLRTYKLRSKSGKNHEELWITLFIFILFYFLYETTATFCYYNNISHLGSHFKC